MDGGLILANVMPEAFLELPDGTKFNPMEPTAEGITRSNIFYALSNGCRFGYLVREFYSIAQHSVIVAYLAGLDHPGDLDVQKAALLHDADEGFGMPDLPSPLAPYFPEYKKAQKRIGDLVFSVMDVPLEKKALVKRADLLALKIEKDRLKRRENEDYWAEWIDGTASTDLTIYPLDPGASRRLFEMAMTRVFDEGLSIDRTWLADQPGFIFL